MQSSLKIRYDAFADRLLSSLSEIERRDMKSFDRWLYRGGGWRWLVGTLLVATGAAWVAARLPWNMSFLEAAVLFNAFVVVMLWAGLSAWFGYGRFHGRGFRLAVIRPLPALVGAFLCASIAPVRNGLNPYA